LILFQRRPVIPSPVPVTLGVRQRSLP
jgi:hypothetical protein